MADTDSYKIRPAGRHLLTIGRELIQDKFAAIVELAKNAYDADSPDVNITFRLAPDKRNFSIIIDDHGHGMSRDTVISRWMVPSTDDKLKRKESPGRFINDVLVNRVMQGRKGIGRYAASVLGNDLLLETVTADGEKTTVYVVWSNFEKAEFLDDVELLVETTKVNAAQGTRLTISSNIEQLTVWKQNKSDKRTSELDHLKRELKKLVSPVSASIAELENNDSFSINLIYDGIFDGQNELMKESIEPFPVLEFFDYKISGLIQSDGTGVLTFSNQKARNTVDEKIEYNFNAPTNCGDIYFDIRVFDRENDAIESLIQRGLKDDAGNYLGILEAKRMLDAFNGVGVYRKGFRIRPLGDPDFDWLQLNRRRVLIPTLRIGSNQVVGHILIQSEEESGLIEKSARDGLRENPAYERLKDLSREVIALLEARRFEYRFKAGLSRGGTKVDKELERLFSFEKMKQTIRDKLIKSGIDKKVADEVTQIITAEEEDKNRIAEDIRQTVAVYQGQATLGKIINVVLHEGRRPLNYFKNQIPNLNTLHNAFQKKGDIGILAKIFPITEGLGANADVFVKLFSRLDPLAAGKRGARKALPLRKTIEAVFSVFQHEINKNNIKVCVVGPNDFNYISWPQDIYAIFTNLIDNSIYWMTEKNTPEKLITIDLVVSDSVLQHIDYRDTGPGIEPNHIESEVIFEPHFSTKPDGTGLGLAIAGEAASRNGLALEAFKSDNGAYFRLQPKVGDINGSN